MPQKVRHFLGHFFMTKKIKYDASFKLKCIELVIKSHQSIYSVAQEFAFSDILLNKWHNDYKAYGSSGLIQNCIYHL